MEVRATGVSVFRGTTRAVDCVDLEIEPARWLGLIGANGSGKTSLLRALAGRVELAAGTILVDGVDRTADRAWRARGFGFAPDAAALPETLTGAELFAILSFGAAPGSPLERLREALDFDPFLGRRIGSLSAGMRQRLAIFCAFVNRPQLVILDEPFNWLDPVCAFDTRAALRAMVEEQGLALVTALHEPSTLLQHCDSGLLLSEGRVGKRLGHEELKRGARDYSAFEAALISSLRNGG